MQLIVSGANSSAVFSSFNTTARVQADTAVQLLNEGVLLLMQLSGKNLKQVIDGLLKAIASIPIGQTKRRPQPRAIKRRPKPYPLLTIPRKQACREIIYN